jgi:uncharacterized membrane protein YfcA
MHIDGLMVLGSAVVGLLVGMTGAGGGALMTPMLILLFSVTPQRAIASDLVAAVFMRPPAAVVHMVKKTVNWRLVGLLCCGSVPMAFAGAYTLHLLAHGSHHASKADVANIEIALGSALLLGAAAMVARYVMDKRSSNKRDSALADIRLKPVPTIVIGMLGGFVVGLTSVGSGSLMIVLLLFAYPLLQAKRLVGTDLTQAVPLTMAAAAGSLLWGSIAWGVTASVIIGSVPAAIAGSFLSSKAPDKILRPTILFVITVSGLKYVGLGTSQLAWGAGITLLVGVLGWLAIARPWQKTAGTQPTLAAVGAESDA